MKLYKALDAHGRSCNGGAAQRSLPVQNDDGTWTPGDWMPAIEGELVACYNGYHLADGRQLLAWLNERLFVAECRGERIAANDKIVVREARLLREITAWNARTARLFAVWCARQELALIANPDPRSVAACDVAERYANGLATEAKLTVAEVAAWDATAAAASARVAAVEAAWASAEAAWASAEAAWAAARAAARATSAEAAWAAAEAAWAAAEAAAAAAARMASAAAWAAARNAAWNAAWDAQYRYLMDLLGEAEQ